MRSRVRIKPLLVTRKKQLVYMLCDFRLGTSQACIKLPFKMAHLYKYKMPSATTAQLLDHSYIDHRIKGMYPQTASWQSENSMEKKVISLGMKLRVQEMFFLSIFFYQNVKKTFPTSFLAKEFTVYEIQGQNYATTCR